MQITSSRHGAVRRLMRWLPLLLLASCATQASSTTGLEAPATGPGTVAEARNSRGVHAVVVRLTVSDVKKSADWYVRHLGLIATDELYDNWARLEVPGMPGLSIGLKRVDPPEGSGGVVTTFVVKDIRGTIARLRAQDIDVEDPPRQLDGGIQLAFLTDPDGNVLAVRQNP